MRQFCAVVLMVCGCVAQNPTSGHANSAAPCSVANTGNGNKIQITCGIGKEQGQKILAILNKMVANQLDTEKVMAKLDELVNAQSATILAPNGIAIGGKATVINPTVNNLGPPPPNYGYTEEDLPAAQNDLKFLTIRIHTDRPVPGAVIGIIFSGPVEKSVEPNMHLENAPEFAPAYAFTNDLVYPGMASPDGLAVVINAPAAFLPDQELIITIKCKPTTHVLLVRPINFSPRR